MNTGTKSSLLQKRTTLILSAVVGFVLAYAFASRAIYTGSLWQYLATFVIIGLSLKLLFRAIRK